MLSDARGSFPRDRSLCVWTLDLEEAFVLLRISSSAEHASAVEVLEQKMLVLEEKSKSTSTENERLASRLDGAFHQVEVSRSRSMVARHEVSFVRSSSFIEALGKWTEGGGG